MTTSTCPTADRATRPASPGADTDAGHRPRRRVPDARLPWVRALPDGRMGCGDRGRRAARHIRCGGHRAARPYHRASREGRLRHLLGAPRRMARRPPRREAPAGRLSRLGRPDGRLVGLRPGRDPVGLGLHGPRRRVPRLVRGGRRPATAKTPRLVAFNADKRYLASRGSHRLDCLRRTRGPAAAARRGGRRQAEHLGRRPRHRTLRAGSPRRGACADQNDPGDRPGRPGPALHDGGRAPRRDRPRVPGRPALPRPAKASDPRSRRGRAARRRSARPRSARPRSVHRRAARRRAARNRGRDAPRGPRQPDPSRPRRARARRAADRRGLGQVRHTALRPRGSRLRRRRPAGPARASR